MNGQRALSQNLSRRNSRFQRIVAGKVVRKTLTGGNFDVVGTSEF